MKAPTVTFRAKVSVLLGGVILLLGIIAMAQARSDMRRILGAGMEVRGLAISKDLAALTQVEVRDGEQRYLLRSPLQGTAGKVLQAAGVAPPPPVRPA